MSSSDKHPVFPLPPHPTIYQLRSQPRNSTNTTTNHQLPLSFPFLFPPNTSPIPIIYFFPHTRLPPQPFVPPSPPELHAPMSCSFLFSPATRRFSWPQCLPFLPFFPPFPFATLFLFPTHALYPARPPSPTLYHTNPVSLFPI